jgi:hypothetical protein
MLHIVLCLCLSSPETIGPPSKIQAAPAQSDLSGIYHVRGHDGKEAYEGACVLKAEGEVYSVTWTTGGGLLGIGVRSGDTLSVGWTIPAEKGLLRGVTQYRVSGRTLTGAWATLPGSGVVRRETLTFLRGLEE